MNFIFMFVLSLVSLVCNNNFLRKYYFLLYLVKYVLMCFLKWKFKPITSNIISWNFLKKIIFLLSVFEQYILNIIISIKMFYTFINETVKDKLLLWNAWISSMLLLIIINKGNLYSNSPGKILKLFIFITLKSHYFLLL